MLIASQITMRKGASVDDFKIATEQIRTQQNQSPQLLSCPFRAIVRVMFASDLVLFQSICNCILSEVQPLTAQTETCIL